MAVETNVGRMKKAKKLGTLTEAEIGFGEPEALTERLQGWIVGNGE